MSKLIPFPLKRLLGPSLQHIYFRLLIIPRLLYGLVPTYCIILSRSNGAVILLDNTPAAQPVIMWRMLVLLCSGFLISTGTPRV